MVLALSLSKNVLKLALDITALLITQKISDKDGKWTCNFRTDITETQETINGGKIERLNAYIDVSGAKQIRQG